MLIDRAKGASVQTTETSNLASKINPGDTQTAAPQKAKKKKLNVSSLLQKAGGVEGVLDTVSVGAGKAAAMIRNKKGGEGAEGVDFEVGARNDAKKDSLFGMPAVAAYTLILVVFILVLFVVFKAASKK